MYEINNNLSTLSFNTGFCIETWLNISSYSSIGGLFFDNRPLGNGGHGATGSISSIGKLTYSSFIPHYSNGIVPLNIWTHVAVQITSSSILYFINGILDTNITPTTDDLNIGSNNYVIIGSLANVLGSSQYSFNGQISQLMITSGIKYSTTFKPVNNLLLTKSTSTLFLLGNNFTDLITNSNFTLISNPILNYRSN